MLLKWAPTFLVAAAVALAWLFWPGAGAQPPDDPAQLLRDAPAAAGAPKPPASAASSEAR